MDLPTSHTFRAVSMPWRLHVGADALRHLADEVQRTRAQRAFVVCGQTVAHKTNVVERIKEHLGPLYAGVFDAMDKDSTWPAVQRGTEAAWKHAYSWRSMAWRMAHTAAPWYVAGITNFAYRYYAHNLHQFYNCDLMFDTRNRQAA